MGLCEWWEFPPLFKCHWQSPCTALSAGNLPAARAVQGDCERVYPSTSGLWYRNWTACCKQETTAQRLVMQPTTMQSDAIMKAHGMGCRKDVLDPFFQGAEEKSRECRPPFQIFKEKSLFCPYFWPDIDILTSFFCPARGYHSLSLSLAF